jgi:hypothetical protein
LTEEKKIREDLETQIDKAKRDLEEYKAKLRDLHPDHPYVQEECNLPSPQEQA